MTYLMKATFLRTRWAKNCRSLKEHGNKAPAWGGSGWAWLFSSLLVQYPVVCLPFLESRWSLYLRPHFGTHWNHSGKIKVIWGNYCRAGCRLESRTLSLFHRYYFTAAQRRWGHWDFAVNSEWVKCSYFSFRGVFCSEVLLESMESFDEGTLMMMKRAITYV